MTTAGVLQKRGTGSIIADAVTSGTPASASAACTAGTINYDADYLYICVATDTWKRSAIATW
jgi:cephalosporin-C deacetylase-like acetyl esterase